MSQENVETIRKLYRAWNRADRAWEFYASDIEWDVSRWAPDLPAAAHGLAEVQELFPRFLDMWEELRFEPDEFIERGDQVFVALSVNARGRGSGVSVVDRVAHVFTLRNGLVTRFAIYADSDDALKAAGLSES